MRVLVNAASAKRGGIVTYTQNLVRYLLERDVCEASLMFGEGGVVDCDAWGLARRSGFGIEVSADRSPFHAMAIAGKGHRA